MVPAADSRGAGASPARGGRDAGAEGDEFFMSGPAGAGTTTPGASSQEKRAARGFVAALPDHPPVDAAPGGICLWSAARCMSGGGGAAARGMRSRGEP